MRHSFFLSSFYLGLEQLKKARGILMDNRVSILKKYIDEARIVMFFGGAGGE